MTMRIIQGVGVTVGLSVRWRHQGFGIICPTCFLFTRFSKDLGLLAPPRIWDYWLNLPSLQKTISGFGIWEYLANQGFGIICPTCLLFRVRKLFLYVGFAKDFGLFVQIETESENYFWIWDLGLFSQPRILNYLPNLLSLQHQSQKIIYVFFSSLNQPRLLLEMARITPFDATNITLWSSNSQMA